MPIIIAGIRKRSILRKTRAATSGSMGRAFSLKKSTCAGAGGAATAGAGAASGFSKFPIWRGLLAPLEVFKESATGDESRGLFGRTPKNDSATTPEKKVEICGG